MVSLAQLIVIAAFITTTYGQLLNVTNSTQDYFLISQRELLHEIEIAELKNDAFDARFADRLVVIHNQQEELLAEIHRVNVTLMPMQALSVIRKHCIQKYDKKLITYDNAKYELNLCYNRAALSAPSLTSGPKSSVSYAKSYVINTLPRTAASCDSNYPNNQSALENCYIDTLDTGKATSQSYLNSAEQQLERSAFDADIISRTAVQCSFRVEKDALETISQTTQDIDTCESDLKKQSAASAVQRSYAVDRSSIKSLVMGKIN